MLPADATCVLHPDGPHDLPSVLGTLRAGPPDPRCRIRADVAWRAFRTPDGPGTLRVTREASEALRVSAWGPGAAWLVARASSLLGLDDPLDGFVAGHPVVARLQHHRPGALRFPRTGLVLDALLPSILGQRVTSRGAFESWRALVRRYGERAPGPDEGLWVDPDPQRLRREPSYALHPLGIERTRAQTLLRACARARRLEQLAARPPSEARALLETLPGIGPWTSALTVQASHGDADAVPVGDLHLPSAVAWTLTGERAADDARMLELLAPWVGHRARVLRLIIRSGSYAPRFGPRGDVPDIRAL